MYQYLRMHDLVTIGGIFQKTYEVLFTTDYIKNIIYIVRRWYETRNNMRGPSFLQMCTAPTVDSLEHKIAN